MLKIREAEEPDADAIARIHADAWEQAYRGIVPQEALQSRYSFESRRKMWGSLLSGNSDEHYICEAEGVPVGFFSLRSSKGNNAFSDLELVSI